MNIIGSVRYSCVKSKESEIYHTRKSANAFETGFGHLLACQTPADHVAVAHRLLMPAFGPLPIKSMFPGTCAALGTKTIAPS